MEVSNVGKDLVQVYGEKAIEWASFDTEEVAIRSDSSVKNYHIIEIATNGDWYKCCKNNNNK